MTTPMLISKQMYYDKYESEFGDGFYPQLTPLENNPFTLIYFQFIKKRNVWKQLGDVSITGLDPPYGEELLKSLNSESGYEATQIENIWNKIIHTR